MRVQTLAMALANSFEAFEGSEHLVGLDLRQRSVTDRSYQLCQEVVGLDDCRVGPAVMHHHPIDVFAHDLFEGVPGDELGPDLLFALVEGGISTFGDSQERAAFAATGLLQHGGNDDIPAYV